MAEKIVLGTRGSELARAQTRLVENELRARWAGVTFETSAIKTRGDERKSEEPIVDPAAAAALAEEALHGGRKGLFTSEIERSLLARRIDIAVHSAKDLASELAPGTQIAAVLPRASVDDVLVAPARHDLRSLPLGGIVATGSVRRKHQLHWKRADLEIIDLHGNVPTRLRKLATDQWHAIILARAGLERLGLKSNGRHFRFEQSEFFAEVLPREIFLPAGGQGVIAMQIRSDDDRARMLVESINDFDTRLCLRAEREFLRLLHGDCNQPVGVLATLNGALIKIQAQVFDLGATAPRQAVIEGPSEDAEALAGQLLVKINA
jgi:hydroxymethylbilane synthase